ncbi:MAG: N-acetylmuramoyl-L-alanine amidase [Verrucomicrobiota bacterium]
MNEVIETIASGLFIWTLRSAAAGLAILALLGRMRKASASIRHLILLSGFALIVAMPLYDLAVRSFSSETSIVWTLPPALPVEPPTMNLDSAIPASAVGAANLDEPVATTGRPTFGQVGQWLLLGIAAVGVLLFGLRVLMAQWRLSRLTKSCDLAEPRIQSLAQSIQDRPSCRVFMEPIGEEHPVMTWGSFPANILLPRAAEEWPLEKLKVVFQHELTHVRRRDALTLCLAQWIKALQWWNPVIWIMARKLETECEHACDDLVVESLEKDDRSRYAHLVLAFANGSGAGPAHLGMANVGNLETRLTRIASGSTNRTNLRWWTYGSVLLTMLFAPIAIAWTQGADERTEEREFTGMSFKTVILDPGHGGHDSGATFNGVKESDLNLELAKFAQQLLNEHGFDVVMTREDDSFVPLAKRSKTATGEEDAILISIHVAASTNLDARGIEIYEPDRGGLNQRMLTDLLEDELSQIRKIPFRKTETGTFMVLRNSPHPSVSLEAGFLSNAEDRKALEDPVFRLQLAQRIVAAVRRLRGDNLTQRVNAKEEMVEIEETIRKARGELDRIRERNIDLKRLQEAQAEINRLQAELEQGKKRHSDLQDKLLEGIRELEKLREDLKKQPRIPIDGISDEPLETTVIQVHPDWNFVIIDSGSEGGLKRGDSLDVFRGTERIGRLRISEVDLRASVANIVSDADAPGMPIQVRDRVVLEQKEPKPGDQSDDDPKLAEVADPSGLWLSAA